MGHARRETRQRVRAGPFRHLEELPTRTRLSIERLVAALTLLWGVTPGEEPERVKIYRRLQKQTDEMIREWHLDPDEVYFMFGDVGNPAMRDEARERAAFYLDPGPQAN